MLTCFCKIADIWKSICLNAVVFTFTNSDTLQTEFEVAQNLCFHFSEAEDSFQGPINPL